MTVAAFCGTFDPVTKGHLDLIERSSRLFDKVVVFISPNSLKNNMYPLEKRLEWLEKSCAHLNNIECQIQSGLVVDACKSVNATVLIRGIRNTVDFEYEQNMAVMNHLLDDSIETICLLTKPELAFCSSSNVKELLKYGQDVSNLVPECILKEL